MQEEDDEGARGVLAEHRLGRAGLHVKLDKGFEEGVYCLYIEFEELADRVGFTAAHRKALGYTARLKEQLAQLPGYTLGGLEDASRSGDPRRRHDLESTFLSFDLRAKDGSWHDAALTEQARVAMLRTTQKWDQDQAREGDKRRNIRRQRFQRHLDKLLSGKAYQGVDGATKERLLAEVTALVFLPPGRGR